MELPSKVTKASRVNPNSMVIFSQPKMGKTTVLSGLKDCLIIDLEQGSDFVDALKYDIISESRKQKKPPLIILKRLINSIKEANEKKGDYTYKYIAIDTVSALEDIVLILANKMYRDTAMGKHWTGDDVTDLPNGAGL